MFRLDGRYLDGRSTRVQAVMVTLDESGVHLHSDGQQRSASWSELEVAERTRHGQRRLTFADGACLEFDDRVALDEALDHFGRRDSLVVGWQMSWRATLASLFALVAVLAASYLWALPWAAEKVAENLPARTERRLGDFALTQLDRQLLKPTQLKPERIERLRQGFQAAVRAQPVTMPDYQLEFRLGGGLGANALALPGGVLVVTDELVGLSPDDDAILSVLGHELGHVHHRHMTAKLVKSGGLSALAFVLWGDVSSLLATLPAVLLQTSYSRESETEADTFALEFIRHARLRGQSVAELFEAVQKKAGRDGDSIWSSHPATAERTARYRGL